MSHVPGPGLSMSHVPGPGQSIPCSAARVHNTLLALSSRSQPKRLSHGGAIPETLFNPVSMPGQCLRHCPGINTAFASRVNMCLLPGCSLHWAAMAANNQCLTASTLYNVVAVVDCSLVCWCWYWYWCFTFLNPRNALKHHFASLKDDLIS